MILTDQQLEKKQRSKETIYQNVSGISNTMLCTILKIDVIYQFKKSKSVLKNELKMNWIIAWEYIENLWVN